MLPRYPVFIRELLPRIFQLESEQLTRDEAMKATGCPAAVMGKAHERQLCTSPRKGGSKN
jgi:hypothetical protein